MIIGIDGNEANVLARVGVSWCVFNQIKELNHLTLLDNSGLKIRVFLKDKPLPDLPKENSNFKYVIIPKRSLWSQIDLPIALFIKHRDLNYFISPAHYAPRFSPCKTVVIVHDLSYFYYPQSFLKKDLYKLAKWTEYSVKNAKYVISVSQNTKNDLLMNYKLPSSKVSVIYNGFTEGFRLKETEPDFKRDKYLLYIGTLQPRKNIINLILGFEKFVKNNPEYKLFLVGKKGWLYDSLFELVNQHRLTNKVIFKGYLEEEEKINILRLSQALVMPGFYEGFGMPILEAFASGIPVIASNSGALPEIGKNACLYFDPLSSSDLSSKLELLFSSKDIKEDLIKKGKERLRFFSWEKNIREILNLLD